MLNKYQIGDRVIYKLNGKILEGEVYEIRAQTRRLNATSARDGYSIVLEDQPIGYKILGSTYRVQDRDIIGLVGSKQA